MAHFQVTSTSRGRTYVLATTRRENGAIAERDAAVASEYANKAKRGGRVSQGPVGDRDPNGVAVVWYDDHATIVTTFSYQRVPPTVPAPTDDLENALVASLMAINGATL